MNIAEPQAEEVNPVSPPTLPGPTVRGEKIFISLDRAWAWLDGALQKLCPPELNPLAQSGRAANFALVQAVVSGVLMLIWYSPSVQFAYSSMEAIQGNTLGGIVRTAHRYSSDILMLLLFVHAGRMLCARKFSGARWLPWVSGIFLISLIWFIGWTGYWLVWDQPAQQVAVTSINLLDTLPIFGEPLGRSFLANRFVPSLLFFVIFFLHMLLPLGIAVGLVVHLLRLSRVKLLPDWRLGVAMTIGLLLAAILIPAPLDQAADMAVKAEGFTVDAWYMTPLALGLRFQQSGLWMAIFGTLGICMGIPWILGRRKKPETFQAVVDIPRCHSCSQCMNDCPFEAITLVPRTDGKRFPSQASIDPTKCVGCGVCNGSCDSAGIGLSWFNNLIEEDRILKSFNKTVDDGGSSWIAFVAGDLEGGMASLKKNRWTSRLTGYQVEVVPTASWVRANFVEQLLNGKAKGVLIIRDSRQEAVARDANQWVSDRLEQIRAPEFRPNRAGGNTNWKVLDYDASDNDSFTNEVKSFISNSTAPSMNKRKPGVIKMAAAAIILCVGLGAAAIAPSHLSVTNPTSSEPEIVFIFKTLGDLVAAEEVSTAEDLSKPIHMRGRSTDKPHRSPVTLRIEVDGQSEELTYGARGVSSDGPALGEWRKTVDEGSHIIQIEIQTGAETEPIVWTGTIDAVSRRLHVISYDSNEGFRIE